MKLSPFLLASVFAGSVYARNWRDQPAYPCPQNIPNQCTDIEKTGFDWNDLGDNVPVTQYHGYEFQGWTCGSTPGKKSHSKGNSFGDKRIGCGISQDDFTNTITCPSKEFSIGEMEVSTDVDSVDLEVHYIMPDNTVCKKFATCYKEGETIQNDQCGGAKSVRIKIPKSSGVTKCNFFIHKIKFVCGNSVTTVPVPTTLLVPPTSTPDCGVPGKPDCSSTVYPSSDTVYPVSSDSTVYPGSSSYPTAPGSTYTNVIPGSTVYPTASTPVPKECGVYGKPDCVDTSSYPSSSTVPKECGVYGKPDCVDTSSYPSSSTVPKECGVYGKPDCVDTSSYPSSSTVPKECGVYGKPDCVDTSSYPSSSTVPKECGVYGKPDCVNTSSYPSSSTVPKECGVYGKPDCVNTSSYPSSSTVPKECGVYGKPDCVDTSSYPSSSTVPKECGVYGKPDCTAPYPDCASNPYAEGCATSNIPSRAYSTPTSGSTSVAYLPPGPPQGSCPDVVPKCLKTWIFKTSCTDTADTSCFCSQPGFIEEVAGCIQSWGGDDSEVGSGLSYLLGLCGEYVSNHPTVATCIPDTITLPPVADIPTGIPDYQSGQETPYAPPPTYGLPPPPAVTIVVTRTKVKPCPPVTITNGPSSGEVIALTTIEQEYSITVPNVELVMTKTDSDVDIVYQPPASTTYGQPGSVPSYQPPISTPYGQPGSGPSGYPDPQPTTSCTLEARTLVHVTRSAAVNSSDTEYNQPLTYEGAGARLGAGIIGVLGGGVIMVAMMGL